MQILAPDQSILFPWLIIYYGFIPLTIENLSR